MINILSISEKNCPRADATRPHWWLVSTGSGIGLVPLITWANVDQDRCRHMSSLGLNTFAYTG